MSPADSPAYWQGFDLEISIAHLYDLVKSPNGESNSGFQSENLAS
jgi:hypothetical protein